MWFQSAAIKAEKEATLKGEDEVVLGSPFLFGFNLNVQTKAVKRFLGSQKNKSGGKDL